MHLQGTDPFALFAADERARAPSIRRMPFTWATRWPRRSTALTLGKNYMQDQALRWGFLTVPEQSHAVVQ